MLTRTPMLWACAHLLEVKPTACLFRYEAELKRSPGYLKAQSVSLVSQDRSMSLLTEYRLAIAFLCLSDCMNWMEQHALSDADQTKCDEDLFVSPRMAQLSTNIANSLGKAFARHHCAELLCDMTVVPRAY